MMNARRFSLISLLAALLALPGGDLSRAQEASVPPVADTPPPPAAAAPIPAPAPAEPATQAEAAVPAAFPLGRYEESWKTNPFMLKTAPVAVVKVSFAEDWALASISKRDGKAVVRIQNKKTGERRIVKETPGKDEEFRLVTANVSRNYKESTAEIAKGDEVATIKHDETLAAARAPAPGVPRPGQPGVPGIGTPGLGVPLPGQPRGASTMAPGAAGRPGYTSAAGAQQNTFQRPGMAPPGASTVAAGGAYTGGNVNVAGTVMGYYQPAVQQPAAPVVNIPLPGASPAGGDASAAGATTGNLPAQGTPAPVVRRRGLIPSPYLAPAQ